MKKKDNKNIIVIVLGVIVLALIIALTIIIVKKMDNDRIDDLYERIEDNYDVDVSTGENDDSNSIDASTGNNTNASITKQQALDIVLKDLKIKQSDIYDLSIEYEYKYGANVYEIDFNYQNFEYEYYINVKTSKIVKAFRERD